MVQAIDPEARAVLTEWFGPPGDDATWSENWPEAFAPKWWKKDPAYDTALRARFGGALEQAKLDRLDDWRETSFGTCALIILLDQFSRNIHRDTPEAFVADEKALRLTRSLSGRQELHELPEYMQCFVGMPFMHTEDRAAQREGQAYFRALRDRAPAALKQKLESNVDFMDRHAAIVARFGRFPHRNQILGRASSPEEIEFLKQPGSSF